MDPNEQEVHHLIQQGEHLELEFKSDRQPLPDRELVAAEVALANTEGVFFFWVWKTTAPLPGCTRTTRIFPVFPG